MLIELSQNIGMYFHEVFFTKMSWWVALGFLAQGLFTMRFLVQWIASERAGRSYVPLAFWWLSLAGSMLLLAYAIHRKDPVFVLGQAFGWVVYARNLVLIRREAA
jgi:lipid-A-disaccharide synthase-like uncharacterized protein